LTVELLKQIIERRIESRKKFSGKLFIPEHASQEIILLEGILKEYDEKK